MAIEFDQPVATLDTSAVHLEMFVDTVLTPVAPPPIVDDTLNLLRRRLPYVWEPGAKYRITIDSAAITGIYGEHNKPFKHEFTVKPEEEYSAVDFAIRGLSPGDKAVVQLLGSSDNVQYSAR